MGVYYSHYLIPQDNTVRPHPDQIVSLIDARINNGFIIGRAERSTPDQYRSNGARSETGARFATKPAQSETVEQETTPEPQANFWTRLLRLLGGRTPNVQFVFRPWGTPFSVPPVGESLSALAKSFVLIRREGDRRASYPLQTIADLSGYGAIAAPAPS